MFLVESMESGSNWEPNLYLISARNWTQATEVEDEERAHLTPLKQIQHVRIVVGYDLSKNQAGEIQETLASKESQPGMPGSLANLGKHPFLPSFQHHCFSGVQEFLITMPVQVQFVVDTKVKRKVLSSSSREVWTTLKAKRLIWIQISLKLSSKISHRHSRPPV